MSPPPLPSQGTIVEWNPIDCIGKLLLDDGEAIRLGKSACVNFEPEIGVRAVLTQVHERPLAGLWRAKIVSSDGVATETLAQSTLEQTLRNKRLESEQTEQADEMTVEELSSLMLKTFGWCPDDVCLEIITQTDNIGMLKFFEPCQPSEMIAWLTQRSDSVDKTLIPIAHDGGGNYVLLGQLGKSEDAQAFFFDHETEELEDFAPHLDGLFFRAALYELAENFQRQQRVASGPMFRLADVLPPSMGKVLERCAFRADQDITELDKLAKQELYGRVFSDSWCDQP